MNTHSVHKHAFVTSIACVQIILPQPAAAVAADDDDDDETMRAV